MIINNMNLLLFIVLVLYSDIVLIDAIMQAKYAQLSHSQHVILHVGAY